MNKRNLRHKERGMALLIALLALFLISAIGMGMIYMSNTETSINSNYKDTQVAFFAMRGGLEEVRDRMRSNSPSYATSPLPLPTVMPSPSAAGSIVYIRNPGASESVDPKAFGTTYFDDEFCHEWFAGLTATYVAPGTGTACGSAQAPALSSAAYVPSTSPGTNTASSLKYKWVRITLKQNNTFPSAMVNSTQPVGSQVCWDTANKQEVVLSALGPYTDCLAAKTAGLQVGPVYIVTSLAITPQGSRRIGQYETAAASITPPPGALALDGPGLPNPIFNPAPNSNQYYVNGNDGSAPSGSPPAVPGCSTGTAAVPAIGTSATGVTSVIAPSTGIPTNRDDHYIGSTASPAVVDDSSQLTGLYATPGTLNSLASTLANGADVTINCGIGAPCSGTPPYGSTTNPQITFVNGDFNFGSNSGAGVLVVTGSLNITGNASFAGLVLVIGQGIMSVQGGGNGTFYGSVFIADTNSHTSPYAQLASLGQPLLAWNGGGGNGIYYNSCWADRINTMHYMVVASREEMY
jgi:hypothetical protein